MNNNSTHHLSGLTGEQAALLLAADERNLAKKVSEHRPLSAADRRRLLEIVARDTKDTAPEGWAQRATQLATALGLHRNTVSNHMKDPTHPKRVEGLGWNITECRRWYESKGVIRPGGVGGIVNDAMLRKMLADAKKEEARAMLLEARARRDLGELLPAADVSDLVSDVVGEVVRRIRAIPATITPMLAGLPHAEAQRRLQEEIDTCLSDLASMPYLRPSEKKTLLAGTP